MLGLLAVVNQKSGTVLLFLGHHHRENGNRLVDTKHQMRAHVLIEGRDEEVTKHSLKHRYIVVPMDLNYNDFRRIATSCSLVGDGHGLPHLNAKVAWKLTLNREANGNPDTIYSPQDPPVQQVGSPDPKLLRRRRNAGSLGTRP